MGLRFDLRVANWLAHVLDEHAPMPSLGNERDEQEALSLFLGSLEQRFYSSPWGEERFRDLTRQINSKIGQESPRRLMGELRSFLGNRPWTALLIPSGNSSAADSYLSAEALLRDLIFIRPDDPGLILQLQEEPGKIFSLKDVFPAFKTALSASTDWPGVLLWTPDGDSVFLPLGTDIAALRVRARWIFSHLSTAVGIDLALLKMQFLREFTAARPRAAERLTIVHVSDIHLGCRAANLRLPHVQNLLVNLIHELQQYGDTVVPLISGDLMDNPDEDNLDRVRAFLGSLSHLGTEEPIVLLGNHDVRRDGYLSEHLRMAMQISDTSGAVKLFDQAKVAIACFDSVRGGKLARGSIGERQLFDMGSKLDEKCRGKDDYVVVAALHHHPIPVGIPDWYAPSLHERVLRKFVQRTDELEDAEAFVRFAEKRGIAAILHGHKHIPRLDCTDGGIPVIGCGSSVGKVSTKDRGTFLSMNVLTLNTSTKILSSRLLAERVAGGGLGSYQSDELVWSPQLAPVYAARP